MTCMFFDMMEKRLKDVDTIVSCKHTDREAENTASLVGYGIPENALYFAFYDYEGDLQLFEIKERKEDDITHEVTLYAENAMYELTTEKPIQDIRPTATTAGIAVQQALAGTRFQLGRTVTTGQASTRWYYISPYAALRDIESKWPVRVKARYEASGAQITGRYIDIASSVPVWRGKRFEIGKDVLSAVFTEDRRNVVTAIIGRGKGEETGDGYGRRIEFSDVVWSRTAGDPADKPAGQNWIEDKDATARYGVAGQRARFAVVEYGDIEDPAELLAETWATLQANCEPVVSGELTAVALEGLGFPHEAARLGDEVGFISGGRRLRSHIVGTVREYAQTGKDEIEFGAVRESIVSRLAQVQTDLKRTDEKANIGAQVAEQNQGLLQGYIDTMKTQILSSGTTMYTDEHDGGLVFVTDNGSAAVKITGAGILISNTKEKGDWKWETAISGDGIVADEVTTGVLRASLIKIMGTDRFYWDASNIYILNPENLQQQIRIGLYDGVHYGIGYTLDSGATWQSAIGFNGIVLQAGSVSEDILSQEIKDTMTGYGEAITHYGESISMMDGRITQAVTALQSGLDGKANLADLEEKANIKDLQTLVASYVTQTEDSILQSFQQTYTYTVEVDGRLEEFKRFVESYQRFTEAGLELGRTDSPFKAFLSNTKLSFTQGGEEIAYISNNKMYITNAEITQQLRIGNYNFYKMNDGSLAFQWAQ